MTKPWSAVEQSEEYKSLAPQQQIKAKREYWDTVVSTKPEYKSLTQESQWQAKSEFFGGRLVDQQPEGEFQAKNIAAETAKGTVGTIAKSGLNLLSQVVQPVLHPIQTGKALVGTAVGAVQKAIPGEQPQEKYVNAIGDYYKGRYGGADNIAKTVAEDPAGFLGDVAMVGGGASALGKASKVSSLEKATSLSATAKAANQAVTAVRESKPYKKVFPDAQIKVNNSINHGISKSIRPSAVGKGDFKQTKKYYDNANEAVKTIVENKNILKLTDEAGQPVARLPQSLMEFSEAIQQTKSYIYNKWDGLLKKSGDVGADVDLLPIAKELDPIIKSKTIQIKNPSLIEQAKELQKRLLTTGKLGVKEADELISIYNKDLQAYYRNPTYDHASRASVDAMIVNKLRSALDEAVTSATGAEFQPLKSKYGALKAIEKDVNRRAIVDMRKNAQGLIDFTDIFSGADVIRGMATMNPEAFSRGIIQHAIKEGIKKLNDPNNSVKKMFKDVEKLHETRPESFIPELMERIPVDGTLRLTGPQKMQGLPYKTKGLPNLPAEKGGARNAVTDKIVPPSTGAGSSPIVPEGPNYVDPKLRKAYEEYYNSLQ
jgi:hypothetical protein